MSDIVWKKDNTFSTVTHTLSDASGPIDLTGATVKFKMWLPGTAVLKVDAAAGGPLDATGVVTYNPVAADTDTVARYFQEWHVVFSGGEVQDFPNNDHNIVLVVESN